MTKDTQPKTQPTKPSVPSAGAMEAARKIWLRQYPSLPSVDAATVQNYALIIDHETGVAELSGLLEAAKNMLDPNRSPITAAGRLQQAITKCESGTCSE